MHELNVMPPQVLSHCPGGPDCGRRIKRAHGKADNRDLRGPEFLTSQSLGPKTSHMGLKMRTIESEGDLGELALRTSKAQLTHHQQHRRGRSSVLVHSSW